MEGMNEQKYSRNMALSLLAGIVLGAVIMLAMMWALGFLKSGERDGGAIEASVDVSTDMVSSEESETGESETGESEARQENREEATEPVSSEAAAAEPFPTKQPETQSEAASSEPMETSEGVVLSFQLNGTWGDTGGYYYQYVATIENPTAQKVTDWKIRVPGFDDCEVDSYWCCEIDEKDGELIVTPADFNREIPAEGSAEGIGITILTEKEWELTGATIEVETGSGSYTAGMGDRPAAQGTSDRDRGEESRGEESHVEDPGSGQTIQSQGAKGPDIQVGDTLAGHALTADSPVGGHGRLRVENGALVDQNGDPYQMHGISTHGLAWFPQYVSEEAFRTFRNEWDADVMRLAMYSDEYGGYCSGGDKKELKKLVDKGVEYASRQGMYVIIDWHVLGEGNPNVHKEDAIAFFDEMSEKYADYGNVIYEICNEPNGGVSWKEVKQYAEEVIPVIRANDPYGIILVGTPQWSQLIGDAAADPIEGYDNIMYTLHFYAATHKDDLRGSLEEAVKGGLPVFVSECSICDASGNGGIDEKSARAWVDLLDKYDVSFVVWNLSNKSETSALIDNNCSKLSDWSDQELSATGRWFKEEFTK